MPRDREELERRRRQLFRRMEWVFVYAPPLLALFIGVFGALFLAWAVAIPGTSFLGRWALGLLVILGLPALLYWIRSRKNDHE